MKISGYRGRQVHIRNILFEIILRATVRRVIFELEVGSGKIFFFFF